MLPGPKIIRECSSCGKHIVQRTIRSGNTIGARFWTDGWMEAPMLPDEPWLVKCQHCGTLVWINELTQVAEIDWWGERSDDEDQFPDARPALTPTLHDYVSFLQAGVNDKQKERYVRLRAWWAGNDSRRTSGQSKPLDSFEIENLRAFITLLDEAEDSDRIMKAEALRELGEFAHAEKLLAREFEGELAQVASLIRGLTQKKITTVKEIKFTNQFKIV